MTSVGHNQPDSGEVWCKNGTNVLIEPQRGKTQTPQSQ